MRGFLLGFLFAAALAAGAYFFVLPRFLPDPCQACGAGTRCEGQRCVAAAAPAPPPAAKKRPRRGARPSGSTEPSGSAGAEAEAPDPRPVVVLKPGDLKPVTTGDNLTKTEVIDLSKGGGAERDLSDDAIDAVFRPAQGAVIACLDEARGDAQLSGRMTVSFRVQRSGSVSGVRLEAPAYLVQHGLYGCVRPIISGLRFPASSRGQVVSYPFTLR